PDDAVALVDALEPDGPIDLDHAVVEVDEHGPVGDHALLADPDPLVGRDRALLAEHGLRPDLDDPLVNPDLGPVADPGEPPEADGGPPRDLKLEVPAEEDRAVGLPPPAGGRQQPPPCVPPEQAGIADVEHAVLAEEANQSNHGGDSRFGRT